MSLDRFNLMAKLKPYDRWVLECMYDGPIPIEVLQNKINKEKENENDTQASIQAYSI